MQRHIVRNCLAAGTLLAAMAACSDQDLLPAGYRQVTITGEVGKTVTARTQVDDAATSDGCTGILWSAGDRVGVFGTSTPNAPFTGNNTEPARKTTFTGTMQNGDTPLYAYYPYREGATTATAVPVTIATEQDYSDLTSIAANDIKVSSQVKAEGDAWSFTFDSKVALLRFAVDARNMDAQGISTSERLVSIHVEPAEGTSTEDLSAWTGEFTMNLTDVAAALQAVDGESCTTLVVNTPEQPVLTGIVEAYACIAPGITKEQKLDIHLETDKHWISFQVTAEADIKAGYCYDIPLKLSAATDENRLEVEENAPQMLSFGFEAACNAGKILDREAYYDGAKTTTRSVTVQNLDIDEEALKISGCIPYLYDFNLVPTFTVSEGATVTVGGVEQVSGVTPQDFSNPVTYTVTNASGKSIEYTVTVTNTGLPVVVLTGNSGGTVQFLHTMVPDKTADWGTEDKIAIYDKNNPVNNLEASDCGFRLRGNSTRNFPKKPFAIKLATKSSVLGMPKHKRWCLLASWIDRSLIRNGVAFDIAHKVQETFSTTEAPGLTWQPSGQNVELVLNGVHVGNYFLCEQIKIDGNRLDIQDCYEDVTNPTTDNCGYLLEFDDNYDEKDKFLTTKRNLPCMAKDEIGDADIWNYVTDWVQDIEDQLTAGSYAAAYEKLDINSVIDYWFVQELTMNDEYRHPKSVYMYKDGAGKLCAGPVWDFDYQTFPNIANIRSYGQSVDFTISTLLCTKASLSSNHGNAVDENDAPYMWYPLLFQDADFVAQVKARWAVVHPQLVAVTATIATLGESNRISDDYNQAMWPIESAERNKWSWPIAFSGDERLGTYDAVIQNLQEVYQARLNALNATINGL